MGFGGDGGNSQRFGERTGWDDDFSAHKKFQFGKFFAGIYPEVWMDNFLGKLIRRRGNVKAYLSEKFSTKQECYLSTIFLPDKSSLSG